MIRQAVLKHKPSELPLDEMADVRCTSQPLVESRCGKSHGKYIFHTARSLHSHSFFLFQCIFLEEFFLITICTSADGKSMDVFKMFSLIITYTSSHTLMIYTDAAIIWLKIKHPLLQYSTQKRETQYKKKKKKVIFFMWLY